MALSVSDLVNVTVNVSPTAAANRGFGTLLIIGSSTVIGTTERVRAYSTLGAVATDFGMTAPEYLAANIYFAQIPRPSSLMIGRWDPTVLLETPLQAVTACAAISSSWYVCIFAATTMPTSAQASAVASFVEAAVPTRVYGVVTQEAAALVAPDTTSIAYLMKNAGLSRTVVQYSASSVYAIAAFFGRALTVNFNMNKSTITMMWKQEVLISAETLTESQANALKATNCNVFVNYDNGTAIVQNGTVANGRFFDEVHGLDWLQSTVQNSVYNLFYQSLTKIPQTNAGVGQVIANVVSVLDQAVANGLIAAGKWNSDGFGALNRGDYLKSGYYTYSAPVETQSQADREARICPPIQVAIKMAGAIHSVAIAINVNR